MNRTKQIKLIINLALYVFKMFWFFSLNTKIKNQVDFNVPKFLSFEFLTHLSTYDLSMSTFYQCLLSHNFLSHTHSLSFSFSLSPSLIHAHTRKLSTLFASKFYISVQKISGKQTIEKKTFVVISDL